MRRSSRLAGSRGGLLAPAVRLPLLAMGGPAGLLVLAGSLAGCGALGQFGAGAQYPPAKNFTVGGRVTSVVINGGGGSIDVTGSSRATIRVAQQASYSKTPPLATHAVRGTTLTLSYTCPAELVCGISYRLQVPRGVTVRASAGAGAVTLTSLSGPVTAKTGAGLITAVDMRSPDADLTSTTGGIVATYSAAPATLHASTKVGPITLNVPGSVAYQVGTHTLVGTSTVAVRKSATSPHSISASSDLGSITISPS